MQPPFPNIRLVDKSRWYRRFENNGWRPVATQVLQSFDHISHESGTRTVSWHYSRLVRRQDEARRRREKKLAWLRNLYSRGAAEAACDVIDEDGDSDIVDSGDDLESGEDLVAWSESLNFDSYMKDWLGLGTCGWGELVES